MSEIRNLDQIRELDARIKAGGQTNVSYEELLTQIANSQAMHALQAPPAEQVKAKKRAKSKKQMDGLTKALQRMEENKRRALEELRKATIRSHALGAQPLPGVLPFPTGYKPYQDNLDGIPIGIDRNKLSPDVFNLYYGMEKK